MNGGHPIRKVASGQIPPRNLLVGIVFFTVAEVVKHNGRGVTDEVFVGFYHRFCTTCHHFEGKCDFWSRQKRGFVKIPNKSAKGVLHAVAKHKAEHVFALDQEVGNIVRIVREHLFRIDNVGRKMPTGNLFAVDVELVKAERADGQLRLFGERIKNKIAAHIRGGDPIVESTGLATKGSEFLRE